MRLKICLVLILILIFFNLTTAAFLRPLGEFWQNEHKVRLLIKEEQKELLLLAPSDVIINDYQDTKLSLKEKQEYRLSFSSDFITVKRPYYSLQIDANVNYMQILTTKNILLKKGYTNLRIEKEGLKYLLFLGEYLLKQEAEKVKKELEEKDYSPQIISKKDQREIKTLKLYDNQELIWQGTSFYIEGELKIADNLYPGKIEFFATTNGIIIYNKLELKQLLTGILATQKELDLTTLKYLSVLARTDVLQQLFYQDRIKQPLYQGIDGLTPLIEEAVATTTAQVLVYENDFLNIELLSADINLSFDSDKMNYQELLKIHFPQFKLINLNDFIMEKIKVDDHVQADLRFKKMEQLTYEGPRIISILELDLNSNNLYFKPVLAQNKVRGLAKLTDIVREHEALAGINGGYYNYLGQPLGLFVQENQIVSEPINNRTALIMTKDNNIRIEQLDWQGILKNNTNNKTINITAVNRQPLTDELVIFNSYYDKLAHPIKLGVNEIIVSQGKVMASFIGSSNRNRGSFIPEDGFIIQAHGQARSLLAEFKVGDKVSFINDFQGEVEEEIVFALGAGPTLVKNGEVYVNSKQEKFQVDIARGKAPRSALGITADEKLIFITVDGRQNNKSIGISLEELAQFMQEYGIIAGMNLDGGGSTQMVIKDEIMNNPTVERKISNALLIKYKSE